MEMDFIESGSITYGGGLHKMNKIYNQKRKNVFSLSFISMKDDSSGGCFNIRVVIGKSGFSGLFLG